MKIKLKFLVSEPKPPLATADARCPMTQRLATTSPAIVIFFKNQQLAITSPAIVIFSKNQTSSVLQKQLQITKNTWNHARQQRPAPHLPWPDRNVQMPAAQHRCQNQRRQQHSSSTWRDPSHAQQRKRKQQTQNCCALVAAPRSLDGGGHSARAAAPTWFPHAPKD